ncbi:hypothetical protein EU522_00560 [Candidatus Thorarchaeota archaeon]|nr:MAG: hypothetical protein EU522_00560 [Candidatus Thorarchaeota archaeon]
MRKISESSDLNSIFRNVTLGFWLRTSLKIAVLLVLPYGIDFWNISTVDRLYYHSIAFHLMLSGHYAEWSAEFANSLTLLFAIILCIPAIAFNALFFERERNKPIRIPGIIVILTTVLLGILLGQGLPTLTLPGFQVLLTGNLIRFTTLVLVALVFFPILSRESSLLLLDRANAEENNAEEKWDVRLRNEFLGVTFGLLILVMPYVLLVDIHTSFRLDFHLFGSVTYFLVERDIRYNYTAISFSAVNVYNLILYLIVASLQVMYSYGVLRYLRGLGSRNQALICGVLGVLIPLAVISIVSPFYARGQFSYPAPFPVLFLLGIAVLWSVKPLGIRVIET